MEQEVLFVEEIVDPEIERETHGRVIVNLRIAHEVIVEGSEQVRNDIGVVQRRTLLAAATRRDRVTSSPSNRLRGVDGAFSGAHA